MRTIKEILSSMSLSDLVQEIEKFEQKAIEDGVIELHDKTFRLYELNEQDTAVDIICKMCDVTPDMLMKRTRLTKVVKARTFLIALSVYNGISLGDSAGIYSLDHTTAIHCCRNMYRTLYGYDKPIWMSIYLDALIQLGLKKEVMEWVKKYDK